ncbi:hypothetical protein GCM10027276_04080 [Comamonas piscis]
MTRSKEWNDAQLYELAGCVARRMTWAQIADEYQVSIPWVRQVYKQYLHRQTKGTFCHWTPMKTMNMYLDRQRGASVSTLAHNYRCNVLVVMQKLGYARRLVEGLM